MLGEGCQHLLGAQSWLRTQAAKISNLIRGVGKGGGRELVIGLREFRELCGSFRDSM